MRWLCRIADSLAKESCYIRSTLKSPMNQSQQRRILKTIAALAIVSALLLLLFPHAIGSHAIPFLWLALVPVVFALLEIPSSQRLPVQVINPAARCHSVLPARFQRPPPSA